MAVTPKSFWPWVRTLLHSVFDQPDKESVAAQYDRIIDALADKLPKVAEHLEDARTDLLAFTAFPSRSGARSGPTTPYPLTGPRQTRATRRREDPEGSVRAGRC
jgi:putative transposase